MVVPALPLGLKIYRTVFERSSDLSLVRDTLFRIEHFDILPCLCYLLDWQIRILAGRQFLHSLKVGFQPSHEVAVRVGLIQHVNENRC